MVPTMITAPSPPRVENSTAVTSVITAPRMKGLSPANSATQRIRALAMPCLFISSASTAPNIVVV